MKKSLFILALAAVASQGAMAASNTVDVQFKGLVVNGGCKITAGDGTGLVDLGEVDAQNSAAKGKAQPVYFNFAGCDTKTISKIEVAGIQGQQLPFNPATAVIPTDKQDVSINLLKMDGSPATGGNTTVNHTINQQKIAFFQAQLDAQQGAAAGPVEATVNFRLTYN